MADRETSEDFFAMDTTFRGEIISVTTSGKNAGGIQAYGHGDEEVLQDDQTTISQHYGFSSYPVAGTELILQPMEDDSVFSVAENPDRPSLASGESKMWSKNSGQELFLKADGSVDLKATAGLDCNAASGNATFRASGFINLSSIAPADFVALASLCNVNFGILALALNAFIVVYDAHTHVVENVEPGAADITSTGPSAPGVAVPVPMPFVGSVKVKTD